MVFNATMPTIFQLFRGSPFYCWRKPEHPEKITDLPQVTDKQYHIILYRLHIDWAGLELTTLMEIGTDCICRYKSNYHTIMATTAPQYYRWSSISSFLLQSIQSYVTFQWNSEIGPHKTDGRLIQINYCIVKGNDN